jgi:hypothetical protein
MDRQMTEAIGRLYSALMAKRNAEFAFRYPNPGARQFALLAHQRADAELERAAQDATERWGQLMQCDGEVSR